MVRGRSTATRAHSTVGAESAIGAPPAAEKPGASAVLTPAPVVPTKEEVVSTKEEAASSSTPALAAAAPDDTSTSTSSSSEGSGEKDPTPKAPLESPEEDSAKAKSGAAAEKEDTKYDAPASQVAAIGKDGCGAVSNPRSCGDGRDGGGGEVPVRYSRLSNEEIEKLPANAVVPANEVFPKVSERAFEAALDKWKLGAQKRNGGGPINWSYVDSHKHRYRETLETLQPYLKKDMYILDAGGIGDMQQVLFREVFGPGIVVENLNGDFREDWNMTKTDYDMILSLEVVEHLSDRPKLYRDFAANGGHHYTGILSYFLNCMSHLKVNSFKIILSEEGN